LAVPDLIDGETLLGARHRDIRKRDKTTMEEKNTGNSSLYGETNILMQNDPSIEATQSQNLLRRGAAITPKFRALSLRKSGKVGG